MLRRDMTTLLIVNAGLHPPFLPSYRMSRHTWPLLQLTTQSWVEVPAGSGQVANWCVAVGRGRMRVGRWTGSHCRRPVDVRMHGAGL